MAESACIELVLEQVIDYAEVKPHSIFVVVKVNRWSESREVLNRRLCRAYNFLTSLHGFCFSLNRVFSEGSGVLCDRLRCLVTGRSNLKSGIIREIREY